jgi:hypothetical protein
MSEKNILGETKEEAFKRMSKWDFGMNEEEVNPDIYQGYFIYKGIFESLREIEKRLHGGSDAMRDEGHKLWLILNDLPKVELNQANGCFNGWAEEK